jgi:hypothetical protein
LFTTVFVVVVSPLVVTVVVAFSFADLVVTVLLEAGAAVLLEAGAAVLLVV